MTRARIASWLQMLSTLLLAGLLLTLPFWRHRVLLHRPAEPLFFEFRDITLYTNDLLWWGAVGAWLASRLVAPEARKLELGPWFLMGPLLGVLALGAAGVPGAVDPPYAGYQALRLAMLLALYLLLINAPLPRGAIAWPLAGAMVVQSVFAVPQFALGRSLGLKRLGEVVVQAAWPGASVVMVGEARYLRAYGLTQHPNLLAGCLMATLLVVGGAYLARRDWKRLPLLAALGAGYLALLLTFSRAAWLGTLVGGLAAGGLLLWAWHQSRWKPASTTILLLAAVVVPLSAAFVALNWPLLEPRLGLSIQGTEIRSVEARQMQVPAAWALIQMRPLLGLGLGNYPIGLYTLARDLVAAYPTYQPVYSVPLLVTAELGFVGGLLWLSLLVLPWVSLWLRRREIRMTAWWAGLSGALLALSVTSLADYYVWTSHQGRLTWWVVLGLWAREWYRAAAKRQGTGDRQQGEMALERKAI